MRGRARTKRPESKSVVGGREMRKRIEKYFRRTGLLPRDEALRIFRKLQAARS